MSKNLLNSQELTHEIKNFLSKNSDIWDIVVYGSSMRGKEDTRDIDFAIITNKVPAAKKLILAQELKEMIEGIMTTLQIDVRTVDIEDFLDPMFVARQGILAEGYCILRRQYLATLLGFETFAIIKYSLKGRSYSQKKMLYYALKGRRGMKGVLAKINGELIGRGLLKIPISSYEEVQQLLGMHKISYMTELVMSYGKR